MYIKSNRSYRMPRLQKLRLASIRDPHQRGVVRQLMVQADMHAAAKPTRIDKKPAKTADEKGEEQ